MRKFYHTEVYLRVGNICTQYRAKFKSNSWAIDTVYVYIVLPINVGQILSSNAVSIAQLVG